MDDDLLLEFFTTFARIEYAMKATNLFRHRENMTNQVLPAEPDWIAFADRLHEVFDQNASAELAEASQYLIDNPPNRQVVVNGALAWETLIWPDGQPDVHFLLQMVRRVRNNLFHGGKYNADVHYDQQRNERLIRTSLTVIHGCLAVSPEQEMAFHDATL